MKDATLHRVLTRRLLLAGLGLAIMLALGVILVERSRISDEVVYRVLEGVARLNEHAISLFDQAGLPDRQGIQHELDRFAAQRLRHQLGRVVYAKIYDLKGSEVASVIDTGYGKLEPVVAHMTDKTNWLHADGAEVHEIIRLDGSLFIKIALPFTNRLGEEVAVGQAVFAVSEEVIADIWLRALRSAALAAAIVLLTTGILYPVILTLLRRLAKLSMTLLDANLETLQVLGSAIAKRDSDTDAHNYRVTIMSVRLAEAVGMESEAMQGLIKGAFLHDVGKIGIPDDILLKPGRLTESEYAIMREHVNHGLEIIERSSWLQDAAGVVGYHHEKFDGSGYPHGISGEDSLLTARIFAIVDVFDALTSERPYKEPFSFDKAMSILQQGRGSHFEPRLLDAFSGIAMDLYKALSNCGDDELRTELEAITGRYFSEEQVLTGSP